MKLWSSFKKELILASRGFYFYVELGFAIVLMLVVLFAIPENFSTTTVEYLHLDLPRQAQEMFLNSLLEEDPGSSPEAVELEAGGNIYKAKLIRTEEQEIYILDSEEAVREVADSERNPGAVVTLDGQNRLFYRYYLQGYESERLKNLLLIVLNESSEMLQQRIDEQEVRSLTSGFEPLSDRENTLPPIVAFSGSLMGMFVMAAYVFLDKKEGVIEAYAVTSSSVGTYILSKVFVLLLTTLVSGLIIIMPVMGFTINYGLVILLLLATGFFASVVGLLVASFHDNMTKAFGVIYLLFFVLMIPGIAYFIPGWDPFWVKIIPTYPILQAFKEIILPSGDTAYPLYTSAGFLAAGAVLFVLTDIRFKRTLRV
jgi:ABC-2 type transport system permease protein